MSYATRTTRLAIFDDEYPRMYGHHTIHVAIEDEGVGEFVELTNDEGSFRIDPREWPTLRAAIDTMMEEVREHSGEVNL